ncbi:MAG: UDP-glucose 4-epimerase family protein [Betaproteobacteria bacterium]
MILVTGANGFVGSALCRLLAERGDAVRGAVHRAGIVFPARPIEFYFAGDIDEQTDWTSALSGVAGVVHLAARTHVMESNAAAVLPQYRRVNVEGTRRLAESAARAGVKRFVYLSSIKVNGESTATSPFTEKSAPHPEDAYGISKWEAEQALWRVASGSGLELVVLRAPLVYGPGVKGNMLRLMKLLERGIPLPLASVHNRRSLIGLGNLVEAIALCLRAPDAAGSTFLVSDGEDVSTPELITLLGTALGTPARLFPCPAALLALSGAILGRRAEIARLTGSLLVDSSLLRNRLGWRPAFTLAMGLQQMAGWYSKWVKEEAS